MKRPISRPDKAKPGRKTLSRGIEGSGCALLVLSLPLACPTERVRTNGRSGARSGALKYTYFAPVWISSVSNPVKNIKNRVFFAGYAEPRRIRLSTLFISPFSSLHASDFRATRNLGPIWIGLKGDSLTSPPPFSSLRASGQRFAPLPAVLPE